MAICTYIDGIASSQAIDTAGEIVDIMGLDCSSLLGAAFNYEHKSDVPAQIVGKVLEFKKIFSEKDCETDRQKYYWQKLTMPFLYVLGRLFDDKKESSKEIAALFRDDAENPTEPKMVGFSIEGAKVNKEGMTITRSIARKVTITNMPANKTCVAEMIPAKKTNRGDPDSLFKGEIEFFSPNDKYLEFLQKREQEMAKDVGSGGGAMIGSSLAMNELEKAAVPGSKYPTAAAAKGKPPALTIGTPKFGPINPPKPPKFTKSEMMKAAPDWQHKGAGHFHHPEHGIVSVMKQPGGQFHVKHNGAMAGLGGKKAIFNTAAEAGAHAGNYMRSVSQNKVHAPAAVNRPSPSAPMNKALTAGSGMAAPAQLEGGAALGKESLDGKMKKAGMMGGVGIISGRTQSSVPKEETAGVGTAINTTVGKSDTGGMGTMGLAASEKKSKWLARAEQAYQTWEKREQFETFMKSKMPHLTKGEIKAIGQTLALKKAVEAEKSMSKMFSSYFGKTTDIMMANEKKK
jgi:hypothetical protein